MHSQVWTLLPALTALTLCVPIAPSRTSKKGPYSCLMSTYVPGPVFDTWLMLSLNSLYYYHHFPDEGTGVGSGSQYGQVVGIGFKFRNA